MPKHYAHRVILAFEALNEAEPRRIDSKRVEVNH